MGVVKHIIRKAKYDLRFAPGLAAARRELKLANITNDHLVQELLYVKACNATLQAQM